MLTITLKINERSKAGKALKDLIDVLAGKPQADVEIISEDDYDVKFVKKIKDSYKNDKRVTISTKELWESI